MKTKKYERTFKNIIGKQETRPILQCLHFDENGSVYATDSHQLLRIRDFHNLKISFNLNLLNFEIVGGTYPDINRLIPEDGFKSQFEVNVESIKDILPFLKAAKEEAIDLYIQKESINCKLKSSNYELPIYNFSGEINELSLNAKFLFDCLQFFKDFNISPTVKFIGSLKPLLFTAENIDYLITPLKKF
ncbi:hypothetical protein DS832_04765 [Bombilactobacillus bombi]|uniref:DNA polymerase III beta sliding clamp central domain-containing protein n=1 Tax=Bombilactobacillus bombi TaxID=1303590 RepID=A0A3R7CKS4_9LACO|nr:hypothetical protein [Bombilactobacillus bombi]RHW46803.1 hypothetical protein DS832_04765 [Bombilactobacillus bombi]